MYLCSSILLYPLHAFLSSASPLDALTSQFIIIIFPFVFVVETRGVFFFFYFTLLHCIVSFSAFRFVLVGMGLHSC